MLKLVFRTIVIFTISGLFMGCNRKPDQSEIIMRGKEFTGNLISNQYKEAYEYLDSYMTEKYTQDFMRNQWAIAIKELGSFKQMGDILYEKQQELHIVTVPCNFEKNTLFVRLMIKDNRKIVQVNFAPKEKPIAYEIPDYINKENYREINLEIVHEGYRLPAIMTIPVQPGNPVPVILLIPGSGPQDRDQSIGPNKIFKDLALGLAQNGIATLRYDKRSFVYGGAVSRTNQYTIQEELVDDALAAARLLRTQKSIDPQKIFLLGFSLGGQLIPRITEQDNKFAGYILMAATSRPLEDVLWEQMNYVWGQDIKNADLNKKRLDTLRQQIILVKSDSLNAYTPATRLPFQTPASYWLDLRNYDPLSLIKKINQPILVIQGRRDYQTIFLDYKGWQDALEGKKTATFINYPSLNHLFMEGEGMSVPQEYMVPGHVKKEVITDIAQWLKKN